jgi:mono/diheme cytochrome c family protein
MRTTRRLVSLLCAAGLVAAASGDTPEPKPPHAGPPAPARPAGSPSPIGGHLFREHCAPCHGRDGRGEGPLSDNLRFQPPDLTTITRRHGGEFPTEKLVRLVDGRAPVKGHGGSDMPVWGDAFRNAETGYDERTVQLRIAAIVAYLRALQVR